MRAIIQRVSRATLSVEHNPKCTIGQGLVILLGVEHQDTKEDADWLAKKIANLRIFYNEDGVKVYEYFIKEIGKEITPEIQTGEFGTYMQIDMVNDGPVTIFIDTKDKR